MSMPDRGPEFGFTVQDAARLYQEAMALNGKIARQETDVILAEIRRAAESGETSTSIDMPYKYRELITKRLEAAGFVVKTIHDGRDGDYTTVSGWVA